MKTTSKILATILAIVLLISMLPMVSNAATLTINNNTPSSGSTTYEVYKILSGTAETGYTLTEKAKAYFAENVSVNGETGVLDSADKVLEYLTDLATDSEGVTYVPATKDAFATDYREKVDADQTGVTSPITDVEDGYYLIYDENGDPKSQNMLVEVKGDTTINVKAIGVTVEKQATNGDSHYVGETVDYTIKTAVPNMTGYNSYTFTITDNPTNLNITAGTVKVSIGGTDVTTDVADKISVNDNVLTIELGDYLFANKADLTVGDEILVTYDAVVTNGAISSSTATNSATITYSNDPNTTGTGKTEPSTETVYTYSVTLNKKSTIGKDLEGAEFVVKDSAGKYIKVDPTTKAITLVENQGDATVYTGGTFTIEGLKEGTYELVEIKAPEGYTTVSGLTFTISNDDNSTIGTQEPQVITHTLSENSDNLELVNGTELGKFEMNVINSKTTILPSTGGIGTTIFTVVGIAVMAGAVIALVVINRKNNK